jgi:hypothetical protein
MIEPELKDLLQKNLEASEESLGLLRKMRKAQVYGGVFTFIKWALIIGASLGAYYYIEPYLNKILDMYTQINETVSGVQRVSNSIDSATASTTSIFKRFEEALNSLRF